MATLKYLSKSLRSKVKVIDDESNRISKHVALTILGDLVYHTPVDTSRAISNWQVSINSPASTSLPAYYKGEHGSTMKASASAAYNEGKRIIENKKPGDVIYLSNTLRYIVPLNNGHSKQVPAGFVERAAALGRIVVENEKVKV